MAVAPGVVVAEVEPDSLAAAAGLVRGDVIEEVSGRAIRTGGELRDALQGGGEDVLCLCRRDERLERIVGVWAEGAEGGHLGVTVVPGVVVAEVFAGSPAAEAVLARGDVIEGTHVNRSRAATNSSP